MLYCGETSAHLDTPQFLEKNIIQPSHLPSSVTSGSHNSPKYQKRIHTSATTNYTINMTKFSLLILAIIASSVSAQKPKRLRQLQTMSPVAVMIPVAVPTTSSSSSSKSGKGSSSSSSSGKGSKRQLVHYKAEYEK